MEWDNVFALQTPLLEIFLRGTLTYLALFLLLRLILRREAGTVGILDMLVVVVVAEAASPAFVDDYRSVTDGIILVMTIIFWNYMLNWLGYRFPALQRLLMPPPLELVRDGEMNRRNMRKEFITEEELQSLIREQGIDDLKKVKRAFMEGNGSISVIASDQSPNKAKPQKERSG